MSIHVSTSQPQVPRERPPDVLWPILGQFAKPTSWLGRLAGRLMAKGSQDDRSLIDLLDIQPNDRVLEIGFGPGVAVELAAAKAMTGLVAGVDVSDVMVAEGNTSKSGCRAAKPR